MEMDSESYQHIALHRRSIPVTGISFLPPASFSLSLSSLFFCLPTPCAATLGWWLAVPARDEEVRFRVCACSVYILPKFHFTPSSLLAHQLKPLITLFLQFKPESEAYKVNISYF
ncbi:hypothetical protein HanXRQr2_Chr04g0146021 [Helianthus annuus]|uniref:Uncharacterized protein n=1 Tax=Helianthus annuus TaxID=4232 RepID=A0A9K3J4A4_HELAN|nr:hypothetical protein HanXRQr2_Chr04g0146021 [Helianthus annuus]